MKRGGRDKYLDFKRNPRPKIDSVNDHFDQGDLGEALESLFDEVYQNAVERLRIEGLVLQVEIPRRCPDIETLKRQMADLVASPIRDRPGGVFGIEMIQGVYSTKLALSGAMQGVQAGADRRALLVIYGLHLGQLLTYACIGSEGNLLDRYNELLGKAFSGKEAGAKTRGMQISKRASTWKERVLPWVVQYDEKEKSAGRTPDRDKIATEILFQFDGGDGLPGHKAITVWLKNEVEAMGRIRSRARRKAP